MRVNKYTATLITFFLSAVVHELGKDPSLYYYYYFNAQHHPLLANPLNLVNHSSNIILSSHVDVVQEAAWLPALLANVASTSGSTQ